MTDTKLEFSGLEKLSEESGKVNLSDDQLLSIIKNGEKSGFVANNKIVFLEVLFNRIAKSGEFRDKILEALKEKTNH